MKYRFRFVSDTGEGPVEFTLEEKNLKEAIEQAESWVRRLRRNTQYRLQSIVEVEDE